MVASSFIICHAVAAFFSVFMVIGFSIQLYIERVVNLREEDFRKSGGSSKRRRPVGNIQWVFHRSGLIVSFLLCARCVDPISVLGIYPLWPVDLFSYNVTTLTIGAAAATFYYTIEVSYQITKTAMPHIYRTSFIVLFCVLVALANVCVLLHAWTDNVFWTYGMYLFGAGLFGILVVLLFDIGAYNLHRAISHFNQHHRPTIDTITKTRGSVASQSSISSAMTRLKKFQILSHILTVLAVAMQIVIGIPLVDFDKNAEIQDPNDFSISPFVFLFLQIFANLICLWYSWMSLSLLKADAHEEIGASQTELSRAPKKKSTILFLGKRSSVDPDADPQHDTQENGENGDDSA